MYHVQVTYRIRAGNLPGAQKRIAGFVEELRTGQRLFESYRIYRQPGDPSSYLHIISYPNIEAQLAHTQLPHVKGFVEAMAGLCESGPIYTELKNLLDVA